eukprot:COSAG05_NODE_5017_length_1288_cov_5.077866_3_plen_109_part_00
MDATDPWHGPLRDNTPAIAVVFLFYIMAGSFFMLNLFVGVIVSSYNEAKADADKGQETSKSQEKRRTDRIKMTHDTALLKYMRRSKAYVTFKGWQIPFVKIVRAHFPF